jgi:tetratricopeptide (TPR) repeat protein
VRATAGQTATAFFALALLVLLAYGGSLENGFVFDDAIFMDRDVRVQPPVQWRELLTKPLWAIDKATPGAVHQYYRPLQLVPLAATNLWFGGSPLPCHLLNLVVHFTSSLLVYGLLRRLLATPTVALLLASLFAVHPALSESVLWLSDISGLGAAACILAVVHLHARARPTFVGASGVAVFYLLSMGFKEIGLITPLLLIAFDATARRALVEHARPVPWIDYGFLLPALSIYLVLRISALGGFLPGADLSGMSLGDLATNAVALLPKYATTFVHAFDLNMYHDFTVASGIDDPRFQTGALMILVAVLIFLGTVRDRPATAFGILWAGMTAAPFLFVRWPWLNVFAERYVYVPSIGILLACSGLLQMLEPPKILERGARVMLGLTAAVLIPLFVWIDRDRTVDWRTEKTIYGKTVTQSASAAPIRNNLAISHLDGGEPQKGIRLQLELLAKNPSFPKAWHNLGLLYLAAERPHDALGAFKEADRREPGQATTLLNLGYAYDLSGQRENAVTTYFRLLERHPGATSARYNLAVIAYETGQLGNASEILKELIRIAPKDQPAREMLAKLDSLGRTPIGDPPSSSSTHRRCREARNAAEQGHTREATAKLRMAAWFDERSSLPHHYLANVYYLTDRIDLALRHQRKAVELAPDNELYRQNLAALDSAKLGKLGMPGMAGKAAAGSFDSSLVLKE